MSSLRCCKEQKHCYCHLRVENMHLCCYICMILSRTGVCSFSTGPQETGTVIKRGANKLNSVLLMVLQMLQLPNEGLLCSSVLCFFLTGAPVDDTLCFSICALFFYYAFSYFLHLLFSPACKLRSCHTKHIMLLPEITLIEIDK